MATRKRLTEMNDSLNMLMNKSYLCFWFHKKLNRIKYKYNLECKQNFRFCLPCTIQQYQDLKLYAFKIRHCTTYFGRCQVRTGK
jgi:hypothetical protein